MNDGRKLFLIDCATVFGPQSYEVWALTEDEAREIAENYAEQLHVAIQMQHVALAVFH